MKVDYNKLFEKIKAEGMTQAVFKKMQTLILQR